MASRGAPSRWWALSVAVPVGFLVAMSQVAPPGSLSHLAFAGTPARWSVALDDVDASIGTLRSAIMLDIAFGLTLAVIGLPLSRAGLQYWAPERRRRFGWWRGAPVAVVAAGVLIVVEKSLQFVLLDRPARPSVLTQLVAALAWWKWLALVTAGVGIVGLVIGPVLGRSIRRPIRALFGPLDRRFDEPAPAEQIASTDEDRESLGICASGGGIRSAAVVLGALRGLAADGTFGRARWLHAVSGGGFTASGWRVSSAARGETDLFAVGHPWFRSVRHRRRYLDNGTGSLVGGIVGVVARTVLVFGSVLAAAILAGWVLGWLTGTWAVHAGFSNLAHDDPMTWSELTAWRLLLPGVIPAVAAVVVFVAARTQPDERFRRRLDVGGVIFGLAGGLLLVVLVGVPIGIRYGRPLLASLVGRTAEVNAGFLGLLSVIGVVAAVRQMLTSELKRRWSRLGGVALAFGLALLAGKVADDRANIAGSFASWWVPVIGLGWIAVLEIPPAHRLTLNGIYRKRLAGTFCLGAGDQAPLAPLGYRDEPVWSTYRRAAGPELVLCGTSHTTSRQHGVHSLGFTFRPGGVTLQDGGALGDGVSAPWAVYPTGSSWDGYPRGWIVSRSMALCGAAFASAMGRQSFGSTNALLAAFNLRLGMWIPNPRFPQWFVDRDTSPRVHLGYFVKELFNRYHPDRDPFVYVADGGHRENLGLVEQLRERPALSIVIDASGDRPGTFNTLRQAIELAGVELGADLDIDFSRIEPRRDDVPLDCVTTGTVTYLDGAVGRIVYAKAQISSRTPIDVRQFAAAHPPFPDYSTGDQFLAEPEFDALVALGEHLAARIAAIASAPGEGE